MQSIKTIATAAALCAALLATAGCSGDATDPGDAEQSEAPAAQETRAPLKLAAQYKAFLYGPDHEASTGGRHTEAWQVLREDRLVLQDVPCEDPEEFRRWLFHTKCQLSFSCGGDPAKATAFSEEITNEVIPFADLATRRLVA